MGKRGEMGEDVWNLRKKAAYNCHEHLIEKEKGSPGLIQVMFPIRKLLEDVI